MITVKSSVGEIESFDYCLILRYLSVVPCHILYEQRWELYMRRVYAINAINKLASGYNMLTNNTV